MKGYTFYEEFRHKRKGKSAGNVIAVFGLWYYGGPENTLARECVAGLFTCPDSKVCASSVSGKYLRRHCKRISEKRARKVHPNLFRCLDKL